MGAWTYIQSYLRSVPSHDVRIGSPATGVCGRTPSASPATGSAMVHKIEQDQVVQGRHMDVSSPASMRHMRQLRRRGPVACLCLRKPARRSGQYRLLCLRAVAEPFFIRYAPSFGRLGEGHIRAVHAAPHATAIGNGAP